MKKIFLCILVTCISFADVFVAGKEGFLTGIAERTYDIKYIVLMLLLRALLPLLFGVLLFLLAESKQDKNPTGGCIDILFLGVNILLIVLFYMGKGSVSLYNGILVGVFAAACIRNLRRRQ